MFNPFLERMLKSSGILIFPSVGRSILELLNEQIDQKILTSIIEQDIGLSATILRQVNSAATPVVNSIINIERAVNILGVNKAFSISFTSVISTQLNSNSAKSKFNSFQEVWQRSILTALLHEYYFDNKKNSSAYILGLTYYLGMIVLMESYPSRYLAYIKSANGDINKLKNLEIKFFETSFDVVSYWILKYWGLPEDMVSIMKPGSKNSDSSNLRESVKIANSIILLSNEGDNIHSLEFNLEDFFSNKEVEKKSNIDSDFYNWFSRIRSKYIDV